MVSSSSKVILGLFSDADRSRDVSPALKTLNDYESLLQTMTLLSKSLEIDIELLRTHYAKLANPSLPVFSLPPELLSYIFELACLWPSSLCKTRKMEEFYQRRRIRGTINFTCSRWRNIAVNTPALWSSISGINGSRSIKLMKLEFERAKGMAVSLESSLARLQSAEMIVEVLKKQTRRLSALDIRVTDKRIAQCLEDLEPENYKTLQAL